MDNDQEMSDTSHSMITRSNKNGGTKKRKLLDVESGNEEEDVSVTVTVATQTLKKAASDDSDDEVEEDDDAESEDDDADGAESEEEEDDDSGDEADTDDDYQPTQEEMELYEHEYEEDAECEEEDDEEEDEAETTEHCECEEEDDADAEEDDEASQERRAQANFARFSQMLFSNPPVVILRQQPPRQRSASDTTNGGQAVNPVLRSYSTDERKYYNTLSEEERALIDASEVKISVLNRVTMPMRFKILQSHIDNNIKAIAINKLQHQELMSPASGEYHKLTNWLDALVNIPFGKYRGVPIIRDMTLSNQPFNPQEVSAFLSNTKNVLDSAVYGHDETKNQMIRFLAQWIVNPKSNGSVIGIHGRPGVGKTTLVKEGICKALDIPFVSIPLGGASDGSYLEGHSYTYEGSMWGKIVDVVMKAGCMNPIIYFDELDKVSTTSRGEEIINILIHLTDPGQNSNFSDKYFTDVPIDLSKCIIIFTYNDDSIINPILKDRLIRIEVNDYSIDDKVRIANNHLIPSLMRQFSFAPGEVSIADSTIKYIVNKIDEEAGVRNLRRSLELIYSTINLKRLLQDAHMEPRRKDSMGDEPVTLPVTITETMSDTLLKRYAKREDRAMLTMYT